MNFSSMTLWGAHADISSMGGVAAGGGPRHPLTLTFSSCTMAIRTLGSGTRSLAPVGNVNGLRVAGVLFLSVNPRAAPFGSSSGNEPANSSHHAAARSVRWGSGARRERLRSPVGYSQQSSNTVAAALLGCIQCIEMSQGLVLWSGRPSLVGSVWGGSPYRRTLPPNWYRAARAELEKEAIPVDFPRGRMAYGAWQQRKLRIPRLVARPPSTRHPGWFQLHGGPDD